MQKRGLVIALVLGVLFISLSFASAFSFSDFFKEFYGKITGKVIDNSAIPSGLVGHWTGDGNALDSSGNGINGVWTGTESYNTGKFGQAFKFDGSTNYIKTSFNNAVNIRDSLTISAWVYYLGEGKSNNIVVAAKDSSGFTYALGRGMSRFHCGGHAVLFSLSNPFWADYCSASKYAITNNQWYHLVVTYDSDKIRHYSNGVLIDTIETDNIPIRTLASNGGIYLGGYEDEKSNVLLDEVMIFNRTLSASEIQTLYGSSNIVIQNPVTCTLFEYSEWSACTSNLQTRTFMSSSPSGCTGGSPVLSQTCPTCNDGIMNGDETGVDCGGSCAACSTTPTCGTCQRLDEYNNCVADTTQFECAPSCENGGLDYCDPLCGHSTEPVCGGGGCDSACYTCGTYNGCASCGDCPSGSGDEVICSTPQYDENGNQIC